MTAKQYLQRAYNLRRRIAAKEMHLEELRTQAEHITADLTGMPRGSGASSPVERIAVQIADLSWELRDDWDALIEIQEEIRKAIESLDDSVVVQILSLRYTSYKMWHEIASDTNYSVSYVFKLHSKGIKAMQSRAIIEKDEKNKNKIENNSKDL